MSLAGLALGALTLLGVGVAVVHYAPMVLASIKDSLSSFANSAKKLFDAPGQALDYLKTSHDLNSNPDQLITDPATGERMGGTFGVMSSQGTKQAQADAAAKRATEPKAATVQRLQQAKALLTATGQPFIIDTEGGGLKLTLDDINAQLAALGVT